TMSAETPISLNMDIQDLQVQTVTVEKLLEPLIIQVTTLVNCPQNPSNRKKGRSKRARVLLASVEEATWNLLDKGEKIAKEATALKEELTAALQEVRKESEYPVPGQELTAYPQGFQRTFESLKNVSNKSDLQRTYQKLGKELENLDYLAFKRQQVNTNNPGGCKLKPLKLEEQRHRLEKAALLSPLASVGKVLPTQQERIHSSFPIQRILLGNTLINPLRALLTTTLVAYGFLSSECGNSTYYCSISNSLKYEILLLTINLYFRGCFFSYACSLEKQALDDAVILYLVIIIIVIIAIVKHICCLHSML
ncbi:catenin alpha-3, partial [Cricetulus griseus]